jgi:hypothetical protein
VLPPELDPADSVDGDLRVDEDVGEHLPVRTPPDLGEEHAGSAVGDQDGIAWHGAEGHGGLLSVVLP